MDYYEAVLSSFQANSSTKVVNVKLKAFKFHVLKHR